MMRKIKTKVSDLAREYAELYVEKFEISDALDKLKARMSALEEQLLTLYAEQGIHSLKIDLPEVGSFNVGTKRQLWAKPKAGDYQGAIPALRKIGLADIIKPSFNLQTLSAWVRERLDSGLNLPQYFLKVIEVDEKPRISVTKAKAPKTRLNNGATK